MRHHNYTNPGFQTAIIGTLLLLLFPLTSLAAPIDDGVTNLLATQQGDGSWISTQTRDSHTTYNRGNAHPSNTRYGCCQ